MCGIVGIFSYHKKVDKKEIDVMLNCIKHRGPDYGKRWIDEKVGLGHRLLKIQDVTEKSVQPFEYNDFVMSYNGEIYNFQSLRSELESEQVIFDTEGDTEVLIKAFDEWGIEKTLKKIDGCFAIALYNTKSKKLYLIRDRYGIKPLHYEIDKDKIIFASEIKAILAVRNTKSEFNYDTVLISLACKLWMDPQKTLFKNIYTLLPGEILEISAKGNKKRKYYTMKYSNTLMDISKIVEEADSAIERSVKEKLISKFPIAAFLSGGLDSSLMCKIANDNLEQHLNTYTVCYPQTKEDEKYATFLAKKEKFIHHNTLIKEEEFSIKNLDEVIYAVEEVLIDKVYVSVFYNYKAAHDDGFRIVLNGQGADEVWLGYLFTWKIFSFINENITEKELINECYLPQTVFIDKLIDGVKDDLCKTLEEYLKRNLFSHVNKDLNDKLNEYSILAINTILHDLLLQEDKLAMYHSVESRTPYIDNQELVELSLKIKGKLKVYDNREKYILRKVSANKLPECIVNREKYPFPEPPKHFNKRIKDMCTENWKEITESMIAKLIKPIFLENIENFSDEELWWLLTYWRFEKVFKMEGYIYG